MRRRSRRAFVLAAVTGVVVVVGSACYGPTEMRVTLITDLRCDQVKTAAIYIDEFGDPAQPAVATSTTCTPEQGSSLSSLGDLVIIPSGSRDARIQVEIRLATIGNPDDCYGVGTGTCVIARRTISFIAHSSRVLPVRLDVDCIGNYCDPNLATTCVRGVCESADTTQPNYCSGSGGAVPCDEPVDASSSDDAPPPNNNNTDVPDGSPQANDAAVQPDGSPFNIVFCDASSQCMPSECCCPASPATPACDSRRRCTLEAPGPCLP